MHVCSGEGATSAVSYYSSYAVMWSSYTSICMDSSMKKVCISGTSLDRDHACVLKFHYKKLPQAGVKELASVIIQFQVLVMCTPASCQSPWSMHIDVHDPHTTTWELNRDRGSFTSAYGKFLYMSIHDNCAIICIVAVQLQIYFQSVNVNYNITVKTSGRGILINQ